MSVITIAVTAEDITKDQDDPGNRITNCGIFHAAKRVIPDVAHVSTNNIVLRDGSHIPLPHVAKRYVRMSDVHASLKLKKLKFDPNDVDMEKLKPITFQVRYTSG